MRVIARPLAPGELDSELVVLLCSVLAFSLGAVWFALHLPWPICVFHSITGHPCLTCGATRSAIACVHADFLAALRWNPLVFVTYCGIAVFDAYAVAVLITRSRRLRVIFSGAEKRLVRGTVIVLLLVNWAYLLAHTNMFRG